MISRSARIDKQIPLAAYKGHSKVTAKYVAALKQGPDGVVNTLNIARRPSSFATPRRHVSPAR